MLVQDIRNLEGWKRIITALFGLAQIGLSLADIGGIANDLIASTGSDWVNPAIACTLQSIININVSLL